MGGGSQNTQTSTSVPEWLKPYLTGNLSNASTLANTGSDSLTSTPVAPLSSLQNQGLSSIGSVNPTSIGAADSSLTNIENGNSMTNATSAYNSANQNGNPYSIGSEASGSLMNANTNPYLQQSYNLGLQGIQNNVDSQFGAAGRNVLASAPVQADQASNLANSIYGGAYNTNLSATQAAQNQASSNYNSGISAENAASAISPSVTSGLYTPGQSQLSAGSTQQTQTQNQLNAPYNTLSWYNSLLSGASSPFGTSNSSTSNNPNSTAQNVGVGLAGASAAGSLLTGLSAAGML